MAEAVRENPRKSKGGETKQKKSKLRTKDVVKTHQSPELCTTTQESSCPSLKEVCEEEKSDSTTVAESEETISLDKPLHHKDEVVKELEESSLDGKEMGAPPPDPDGLLGVAAGEKVEEKTADTEESVSAHSEANTQCSQTPITDSLVHCAEGTDIFTSEIFLSGEDNVKDTEASFVDQKAVGDVLPDRGGSVIAGCEETDQIEESAKSEAVESVQIDTEIPTDPHGSVIAGCEETEQKTDQIEESAKSEAVESVQIDTEIPADPHGSVIAGCEETEQKTDQNEESAKSEDVESVQIDTEMPADLNASVGAGCEKMEQKTDQTEELVAAESIESVKLDTKADSEGLNIPIIECGIGTLKLKPIQDVSSVSDKEVENTHRKQSPIFKTGELSSVNTEISKISICDSATTIENIEAGPTGVDCNVTEFEVSPSEVLNPGEKTESSQSVSHMLFDVPQMNKEQSMTQPSQTDIKSSHLKEEPVPLAEQGLASAMAGISKEHTKEKQVQNVVSQKENQEKVMHRKVYREATDQKTVKPMTMEQIQALYYNQQLLKNPQIIEKFIQNEAKKESHEFYEILLNYYRSRKNLLSAEDDIAILQKAYSQLMEEVWITTTHTVTAQGQCGDGSKVSTTHMYEMCKLNTSAIESMSQTLLTIREEVQQKLSLYAYSSQLSRLQVESYLYSFLTKSPALKNIPKNAPIQVLLVQKAEYSHQIGKLKDCISVLFMFHRRPSRDREFLNNIRQWTQKLVATLLRLATFEDHLFILNHILRCPAGVGTWATKLVQVPPPPPADTAGGFGSPLLDHLVTELSTLLQPTIAREDFMCQMRTSVSPQSVQMENTWIMVDSDGEEDEDPSNLWLYLHENDIVSILKQFPVTLVFAHVLKASVQFSGNVKYDIHLTTEAVIIRVFAFATIWITILGDGLKTYSMTRYRQLNKRLGKMIRQTVSFVSDHWLNFKAYNASRLPPATLERLQLEFDHFFMRSTDCILTAQKFHDPLWQLGSWQFMADMPYTCVSSESMWQLLYILHHGQGHSLDLDSLPTVEFCRGYLKDPDSRQQLADNLMNLQTSETIYLLTTFANMAQCRSGVEAEFIETVAFGVFEISYVCSHTREFCSKVGRELLYTIMIKHPFILSLLLQRVKEVMSQVGMMSLYLFQDLPIQKWMPSDPDMLTLRQWLLTHDLSQAENQLARSVLSHMNWNISEQTGKPVLPIRLHRQVALLIVEAYNKYISNRNMSSIIGEGIRQMASVVRQNQTSEQHFNNWAWDLVLKLKLHSYSIPSNLQECSPPDMAKDDWLLPLGKGVTQKNPMACYVALVMSNIGHDITSFTTEGMDHLQNLLACNQFTAAIHVISCLVPYFNQRSQYFPQSDGFQKVLQMILSADESLFKIAKSVLSYDFPGAITKQLTDMIQSEILQHLSDSSASSIIVFWLSVLLKSPKGITDRNYCFVVDSLIRCTFTLKGTYIEIEEVFSKTFETLLRSDKGRGVMSSVVSWIASGVTLPSLMERSSMPEFTWLAYMVLHTEGASRVCTQLWLNIQQEMHSNPKLPADQAHRQSVVKLKLEQAPAFHRLNIYRWAQQALDAPVSHPLLPVLYQRFFNLYLSRLVTESSLPQRASVGERFFESMSYSSMLKKMKKRLAEAADYHMNYKPAEDAAALGGSQNDKYASSKELHQKLARLYQTFALWLDEPRLHDANLYLPALPPQYESARLLQVFQMKMPWLDLVDLDGVQYLLSLGAEDWRKVINSLLEPDPKCFQGKEEEAASAAERIVRRLRNTESVEDPPPLVTLTAPVPEISVSIIGEKSPFMHLMKADLNVLRDYTRIFATCTARHCAVDETYLDLLPELYSNVWREVTLTIECKSKVNPLHRCSNPAVTNVRVNEKQRNEIIQRKMDENRAEYKQVMIEGLLPPPQNVCIAAVHVENAITLLIKRCQSSTDDALRTVLFDIASSLFFYLASMVNEETNFYPPTKQFFISCTEILGKEFVSRDPLQTCMVLQMCLDQPSLSGLISPHFVPANSPQHFIDMYEQLIHVLQQQNMDLVFMLLTKFDVWSWLENVKPPQVEKKRFIDILGSALMACGAEPEKQTKLVFDFYCGHLRSFLQNNFPSNISEVINVVLQGSTSERLHVQCWEILCIECFMVTPQTTDSSQRKTSVNFNMTEVEACTDTMLSTTQVKEIHQWFGSYFLQVRLTDMDAATFGLYPKLGRYVPYIAQFIGGFMRSLVTKMMPNVSEMNPYQVIELVWTELVQVFSPWIQHLGNKEQTLFPWTEGDTLVAMSMVTMFRKVVEFLIAQLSVTAAEYSAGVLALLLMYYATGLCTKTTPPYISDLYLQQFKLLPWEKLRPDLQLLETIAQMKERTSPNCFKLVSHLLPRLAWPDILQYYQMCQPPDVVFRIQAALLLLLIQTYGDREMLQEENTVQLLQSAENFDWSFVTLPSFQTSNNWFLQVCDPKCVLSERSSPAAVGLRLLKVAAGFNSRTDMPWSPDLSSRRVMYMHTVTQLLCQCTYFQDVEMSTIGTVIVNLLTEIEMVETSVIDTRTQQEESLALIKELLSLLNNCNPDGEALDIVIMTITQWLQDSPQSILLTPCIKAASRCLASLKQMVQIMEACIEVFFTAEMDSVHGAEWGLILEVIQMPELNVEECIKEAVVEGSYLLLHAHVLQQLALCQNYEDEAKITNSLIEWSTEAKPDSENEGKLLLWWHQFLHLLLKQLRENGSKFIFTKQLNHFVTVLHSLGEDRASSGLLGAIGFGKKSQLSCRFRIICRTLAAFLASHMSNETDLCLQPQQRAAITTLSKQTMAGLLSLKSNKQYSEYKDQIDMVCVFVQDPMMHLHDSLALVEQLVNAFFPDKYYLKVVQWR
ncbi:ectopic P granules protein 5 homolog isoform X2 [Gigantopelta aegis]|uniref:ectopic P granules protein 5 homolog isoform X2 n=1 Tax=Gigantopelta aegis TaxID=1735272 RepID=UPI001B887B42|nr:ectopic P granules protein 5 homolog isoform X2 [Gigantopelta aegis]